jgi:hypothetical protein
MRLDQLAMHMAQDAERIRGLVGDVSDEQARWKPGPDQWSVLEVVNHLYDEEREDFRVRLDIILHHPDRPWPAIDPEGWVIQRAYNRRELGKSLQNFLGEREESLKWLRGLASPDWEASYEAPFGPITAGDMVASWVAHDVLHMRQLVELTWAWTTRVVAPYKVNYAGTW